MYKIDDDASLIGKNSSKKGQDCTLLGYKPNAREVARYYSPLLPIITQY